MTHGAKHRRAQATNPERQCERKSHQGITLGPPAESGVCIFVGWGAGVTPVPGVCKEKGTGERLGGIALRASAGVYGVFAGHGDFCIAATLPAGPFKFKRRQLCCAAPAACEVYFETKAAAVAASAATPPTSLRAPRTGSPQLRT